MKLREVPFEPLLTDGWCIYANGHVDEELFLEAVRAMPVSEVPPDVRWALKAEDVQHTRFRPMSPTEARANGFDWGVVETDEGGRPVTVVKL